MPLLQKFAVLAQVLKQKRGDIAKSSEGEQAAAAAKHRASAPGVQDEKRVMLQLQPLYN